MNSRRTHYEYHTPVTQVQPTTSTAAPPPSLRTLAGQVGNVPLTRVALAYVDKRINLYLRFGNPARTIQLDRWRRSAVFLPASIFCRIRWESNDYGTTRWQLMVMQACTPLDAVQRIPGIQPGARLLLHAEGERQVQAVLSLIDAIEALGIASIDVSPAYWRTLGNRLTARLAAARIHRRAARRLARREGIAMTATPRSHLARARTRSPRAGSACPPAALLRWPGHPSRRLRHTSSTTRPTACRSAGIASSRSTRQPTRCTSGSIVLARLPAEPAALAAQRGYLPPHIPLLKRVGAVAPQHVCIVDGQSCALTACLWPPCCAPTGWAVRCHPGSSAGRSPRASCSCSVSPIRRRSTAGISARSAASAVIGEAQPIYLERQP